MNDNEVKKDIIFIAKFVLGAIIIGLSAVLIYLAIKQEGGFLPVVWSLAFLICGGGFGFLFGIPRILSDDVVPQTPSPAPNNNLPNQSQKPRSNYRPSTHLERISEWLTTLIVGLTLVQWRYVVAGFNSIALFIATGLNPKDPVSNLSFAASIMLYFSVTGFLSAYLLTRIYLSRIFEMTDVGSGLRIDEAERRDLNSADLSNPRSLALNSGLGNVAHKILDYQLDQLTSLEDIIAWSKAQLAAGNFEKAVTGYEKTVEIAPNDIQLRLEFANALYYAGRATTDAAKRAVSNAKNEEQLSKAYGLLNLTTNPELRMKVYRAITYFYLFSALKQKDFEKTIRFGEEYDADENPRKITSVGILVNLACAYGQKYKWLADNNAGDGEMEVARQKALEYVQKTLDSDKNEGWLNRLRTLLRSDIKKDVGDDDLEVFENDPEFRKLLKLPVGESTNGGESGGDIITNTKTATEKLITTASPVAPLLTITLLGIATDAGIISRLLLAECRGPAFADYDEAAARTAMKAMRAVVENRKQKPNLFLASGTSTLEIVTAPPGAVDDPRRQFAGFFLGDDGKLALDENVQVNIDDILAKANTGAPGKYAAFVNNAIAIAQGAVEDPFANLTDIGGVAVKKGAFGWRPENNPISGTLFVKIPATMSGIILKTQFYALKANAF